MQKMPKEFWDDMKWDRDHRSEFLDKYPNQWVAIINKKVVTHNSNLSKVEEIAKYKTHRKIIPALFIDTGEQIL